MNLISSSRETVLCHPRSSLFDKVASFRASFVSHYLELKTGGDMLQVIQEDGTTACVSVPDVIVIIEEDLVDSPGFTLLQI